MRLPSPAMVGGLILLLSACPDMAPSNPPASSPPPAAPGSGAEPEKRPTVATPRPEEAVRPSPDASPPRAIEPVLLDQVRKDDAAAEVVAKLIQAHYDAEALGLRELGFSLAFSSKKLGIEAKAEGSWTSGSAPKVTLTHVQKDGKEVPPPKKDEAGDVGKLMGWSDLEFKVLKLVEGIGNGFLSRRLFDWSKISGTKSEEGERLILTFTEGDGGVTRVKIGPRYVVEQVSMRFKQGFSRSMEYKYKFENGRNLVAEAVMTSTVDPGVKLHRRATSTLKLSEGTRFGIEYGPVGRYVLPVKLTKLIPAMGEDMSLAITYARALP